jgi:hypothetical protein
MKRTLSIVITSIIIWALIAYCIFLITQQAIHVSPSFAGNEITAAAGLIVALLAIWFYTTIGWSRLDKPKLILSILAVWLILVGAYAFVDVAGTNTFLSDAIRVVWVYILIASAAWFIGGESADIKNTNAGSVHRVKGAEVIEI